MAVDPISGNVFIDFYDRRGDAANFATRLTVARSSDEGHSFSNYALPSEAFKPWNAFLGDYTWVQALNNRAVIAWTETTAKASRTNTETVIKVGSVDFN